MTTSRYRHQFSRINGDGSKQLLHDWVVDKQLCSELGIEYREDQSSVGLRSLIVTGISAFLLFNTQLNYSTMWSLTKDHVAALITKCGPESFLPKDILIKYLCGSYVLNVGTYMYLPTYDPDTPLVIQVSEDAYRIYISNILN